MQLIPLATYVIAGAARQSNIICHCEERSYAAISNDKLSLRGAQRRGNLNLFL